MFVRVTVNVDVGKPERIMAFSPLCRFAPWLIRSCLFRPLADSPPVPGFIAFWLVRPVADLPLALDDLPPFSFASSSFASRLVRSLSLDDSLPVELYICLI